ncbi:cobalamin biosynthesis protein CobW, partial [Mycobacterium tuberculosis]|nr:cobalamin biosynthesis protein CobW [Mycobacterium tuberculosis]
MTLVTGLDREAVARTADALAMAGTTLVHHDLSSLPSGRVMRTTRSIDFDGVERCDIREISLEHGCVSCTLRIDLLPLLR